MEIKTKFDLGQEVFCIQFHRQQIRISCPDCGGVSEMITKAGGRLICRRCIGSHEKGTILSYTDCKWCHGSHGIIGKILVEVYDYQGGDPDSRFDNYKPPELGSDKERVMLWSTGVGSGTVYDVVNVFATVKEAIAECNRRNVDIKGEVVK